MVIAMDASSTTLRRYLACVFALAFSLASQALSAQDSVPPDVLADIQRIAAARMEEMARSARIGSARGAVGSVSVAARCIEGYVVNGRYSTSAADVKIVAAGRRDCEGGRCRAYQVTAARDGDEPFDLEVSVTCS